MLRRSFVQNSTEKSRSQDLTLYKKINFFFIKLARLLPGFFYLKICIIKRLCRANLTLTTCIVQKRVPKNPIKFHIQLNEEQKEAKQTILDNTITLLAGSAGSGKTLLACNVALDGLFRRQYDKIIITRPTVSKEDIGFLPGDMREKMDPWVQPIYQNFYTLYDKEKMQKYFDDGSIEIVPVSFMRGRTFLDSLVIVDEAQNVTHEQMEMIVSRLGLRSKMIICGDDHQIDLRKRSDSGFRFLYAASRKIKNLSAITLTTNHRDPIVDDLLRYYEEASQQGISINTSGSSNYKNKK